MFVSSLKFEPRVGRPRLFKVRPPSYLLCIGAILNNQMFHLKFELAELDRPDVALVFINHWFQRVPAAHFGHVVANGHANWYVNECVFSVQHL